MSATIIFLVTEQARKAEAARKVEQGKPEPTESTYLSVLRTGSFGMRRIDRAIAELEASGGVFWYGHVVDGLTSSTYFDVRITGPASAVDTFINRTR